MSTLSQLPLELVAYIISYINAPEDISALRLTGREGRLYAQIGVTHLIAPRSWKYPQSIGIKSALLFPYLAVAHSGETKYQRLPGLTIYLGRLDDFRTIAGMGSLRKATFSTTDHVIRSKEYDVLKDSVMAAIPPSAPEYEHKENYFFMYYFNRHPDEEHPYHPYLAPFSDKIARMKEICMIESKEDEDLFRDGVLLFIELMTLDTRCNSYDFLFELNNDVYVRIKGHDVTCCLETFELLTPLRRRFPFNKGHRLVLDCRVFMWLQSIPVLDFGLCDKLLMVPYLFSSEHRETTQRILDYFLSQEGSHKLVSIRYYKDQKSDIEESNRYIREGLPAFTKTYPSLRRLRAPIPLDDLPLLLRVFPNLEETGVLLTDRMTRKDFLIRYPQIKKLSVYRYRDETVKNESVLSRRDHQLI